MHSKTTTEGERVREEVEMREKKQRFFHVHIQASFTFFSFTCKMLQHTDILDKKYFYSEISLFYLAISVLFFHAYDCSNVRQRHALDHLMDFFKTLGYVLLQAVKLDRLFLFFKNLIRFSSNLIERLKVNFQLNNRLSFPIGMISDLV